MSGQSKYTFFASLLPTGILSIVPYFTIRCRGANRAYNIQRVLISTFSFPTNDQWRKTRNKKKKEFQGETVKIGVATS